MSKKALANIIWEMVLLKSWKPKFRPKKNWYPSLFKAEDYRIKTTASLNRLKERPSLVIWNQVTTRGSWNFRVKGTRILSFLSFFRSWKRRLILFKGRKKNRSLNGLSLSSLRLSLRSLTSSKTFSPRLDSILQWKINCTFFLLGVSLFSYAAVAELVDALDSGSSGYPWGFESPQLHHKRTRIVIREICHNFFIFRAKKAKNAEFDTV